ncbi:MAG: hypothetical protein HYV06_07610 [Deltaproteobacteria bacterium]|nr:hypothetical protein [Deltaproteobacteria bacterium]
MFDAWGPSRYETIMYGNIREKTMAARLSGISRAIRISHEPRLPGQSAVFDVACGLAGPLVYFYVWWLLRFAMEKGIRRIYFLARDGHIFMKAAHELISVWKLDIEARYLYCSRESLLLPSYENTGDFEHHWITWGYASSISIAEICRRLGLTIEEIRPFLANGGLSSYASCPERPIAREDRPNLNGLLKDESLARLIREKGEPLFETALSYLEQEKLFDGVPYLIADTGWRGTSQYALSALMHKGGRRPPGGLTGNYLGLNRDVHRFGNDSLHAYLFDWRFTPRDYRLYYFICFEMLFSADHGRTFGYQELDGVIVPLLADFPAEQIKSLTAIHHQKVSEYARMAAEGIPFGAFDDSFAEVSRMLSRAFICSPTAEEAEVYGEWPIASEMGEGDFQAMAPPMGFCRFVSCAIGSDRIRGFWPQASLVRGNQSLLCRVYNRFLDLAVLDWYRRWVLRY